MPSNAASLRFDAGPLLTPRAGPSRGTDVAGDARLPRRRRLRRRPRGLGTDDQRGRPRSLLSGDRGVARRRVAADRGSRRRPDAPAIPPPPTPRAAGSAHRRRHHRRVGLGADADRQVRVERAALLRPTATLVLIAPARAAVQQAVDLEDPRDDRRRIRHDRSRELRRRTVRRGPNELIDGHRVEKRHAGHVDEHRRRSVTAIAGRAGHDGARRHSDVRTAARRTSVRVTPSTSSTKVTIGSPTTASRCSGRQRGR